jgi:hypothetical protein
MANVTSSPILVTLMMEAQISSETSVLSRATWRNIPADTVLHFKTGSAQTVNHREIGISVNMN